MQKTMSVINTVIISVNGSDCRIHFWYMSKDNRRNIMINSNLSKKMAYYKIFIVYKNEWKNLLSKKQRNNIK